MATIEAEPQALAALRAGDSIRRRRAQIRHDIRSGAVSVAAAMDDPAFVTMMLIDVIRCTRSTRRCRLSDRTMAAIGYHAVRDGVNLMLTVAAADERTREWVADRACYGAPKKVTRR